MLIVVGCTDVYNVIFALKKHTVKLTYQKHKGLCVHSYPSSFIIVSRNVRQTNALPSGTYYQHRLYPSHYPSLISSLYLRSLTELPIPLFM